MGCTDQGQLGLSFVCHELYRSRTIELGLSFVVMGYTDQGQLGLSFVCYGLYRSGTVGIKLCLLWAIQIKDSWD